MGEIPSILALEPDPDRAKALTRLVHEYVDANVVVSASADVAVSVISRRMPQLILLSAFIPPPDERSLMTFLRGVTRDNVPVLIISSIPEPSAAKSAVVRCVGLLIPDAAGDHAGCARRSDARCAGQIERARARRHALPRHRRRVPGVVGRASRSPMVLSERGVVVGRSPVIRVCWPAVEHFVQRAAGRVGFGPDAGNAVTFEFCGPTEELIRLWRPNAELAVSAHIVRSEVSKAGPACFRYRVAARFCDELELLSAEPTDESESNPVQVLEIQPAATEDIAGVARRAAEQLQELARVLKSLECAAAGRHRMGAETRSRALVDH